MEIFLAVLKSSELPREKQVIITYLSPNPPQIWKNAGRGRLGVSWGGLDARVCVTGTEHRARQAYS